MTPLNQQTILTLVIFSVVFSGLIYLLYWQGKQERKKYDARLVKLLELRAVIIKAWTKEELREAMDLYKATKINENNPTEQIHLWYSLGILKGRAEMFGHLTAKIAIITNDPESWKEK